MIDKSKITLEWINQVAKDNKNADKILVDRVIYALLLVEGLIKQNINFVFKGGTALMLLFNSTKRLSIDIDIILPERPDNLENIFNNLVKEQGYIKFELQKRTLKSKIDKEHYKFYYSPNYKTNKDEEYVLLDILFEKDNYFKVNEIPVQSSFIPAIGTPLNVHIPTFEDILGDKLTAFAPNTTGIPYFKKEDSMSMEIIKQLYDIGNLFDVSENIKIIKTTFSKFVTTELAYREKNTLTEKDVLEDIFQTSLCISTRGKLGNGDFEQLQTGIRRVKQFIFSENYQIEKAILHASKTAYLSSLIKYNGNRIEKFTDPLLLKDWTILDPSLNKLNHLKKSNPEAFFYWYKIYELIKEEN
jgi:predicted nucleotidyltransferase component of viral defense system